MRCASLRSERNPELELPGISVAQDRPQSMRSGHRGNIGLKVPLSSLKSTSYNIYYVRLDR